MHTARLFILRLIARLLVRGIATARTRFKRIQMNNVGNVAEPRETIDLDQFSLHDLPRRRGLRPAALPGPLHIQCNQHGNRRYLSRLIEDVRSWPHIERQPPLDGTVNTIPIRLEQTATSDDSKAFIGAREFARVLLGAPTIYLALPLVCAHWAIVRGWAEPHYLSSHGLMPPGAVAVYTPKDRDELSICYSFFFAAYTAACRLSNGAKPVSDSYLLSLTARPF
jgi:hypothetical protein